MKVSNYRIVTATYYDPYAYRIVQFCRVFWAFEPSIKSFQYCRPLLSIDSAHLYEKYKGCFLIFTRVDADGGLYALAFKAVEGET